jgi:hypothetical protein
MTTEDEIRGRVEKAIQGLEHESGMALPVMMGQKKTMELRDSVVKQIMSGQDPEMWSYQASSFVREAIVHQKMGVFIPGPDGKSLRVQLRNPE